MQSCLKALIIKNACHLYPVECMVRKNLFSPWTCMQHIGLSVSVLLIFARPLIIIIKWEICFVDHNLASSYLVTKLWHELHTALPCSYWDVYMDNLIRRSISSGISTIGSSNLDRKGDSLFFVNKTFGYYLHISLSCLMQYPAFLL